MNQETIEKLKENGVNVRFVEPMPKGSHMNCPIKNGMCFGRTCVLWDNPKHSELKLISRMCLFRKAMQKISGE